MRSVTANEESSSGELLTRSITAIGRTHVPCLNQRCPGVFVAAVVVFLFAFTCYDATQRYNGLLVGQVEESITVTETSVTGIPEYGTCSATVEERGNACWHFWTDGELLRRSLDVSTVKAAPTSFWKIAFLFLVRNDVPHARLWERFFEGHKGLYSIYIHTSDTSVRLHLNSTIFWGRQIPSEKTTWGSFSLVDAERRLLANAHLDPLNERFILVSETCIPIRPFQLLYNFLKRSLLSWVSCINATQGLVDVRWRTRLLPHVPRDHFRSGSQWFELQRRHVHIILNHTGWDSIRDKWRHPEEHYIPSLFHFHGIESEISNISLTTVDWSLRKRGHPHAYRQKDTTPNLLRKLQGVSNTVFFARKFLPETVKPILTMAGDVLGF